MPGTVGKLRKVIFACDTALAVIKFIADTDTDQPKCCLAGSPRQTFSKVAAAASSAEDATDLKQLLQDALQSSPTQNDTPQNDTSSAGISASTPAASEGLDTSNIPEPSNPDRGKQCQYMLYLPDPARHCFDFCIMCTHYIVQHSYQCVSLSSCLPRPKP